MEWSLHLKALIVLLLAVAPSLVLAQSPCGGTNLTVSISEYPYINYSGRLTIPLAELPSYRALLIQTTRSDLQLTVRYDPNYQGDVLPESVRLDYLNASGTRTAGWYLQMLVGLDRDGTPSPDDDRNTLTYQLECVDPNVANGKYYHVLKIQLEDRNDNQPTFQNTPYIIDVGELSLVGTTLFSAISTLDADKGNNRIVQYKIDTASDSLFNNTDVFRLASADSPYLVLSKSLDYEAMVLRVKNPADTVYRLNITATDKPDNPALALSSWTYLTLRILDEDDHGPSFSYPSCMQSSYAMLSTDACIYPKYEATIKSGITGPIQNVLPIPRDTNYPTQPVVIKARDVDALNAPIRFYISQTLPTGYNNSFRVITTQLATSSLYQCDIRVTTAFYHADVQSLEIMIVAEEQTPNRYTSEANLNLTVQQVNQYSPVLSTNSGSFTGYILQKSDNMAKVKTTASLSTPLRFAVSDRDLAATDPVPRYDIVFDPSQQFGVDDNYFVVLLQPPLERKDYVFKVTVRETDTGERRSSAVSLTVSVLDVNDTAPTIPPRLPDVYRWEPVFDALSGSKIHYRCPDGLFDVVECWRDKTGADNNRCISSSDETVNLIASNKANVVLMCDNVTRDIGICWCKETSLRKTCTARLLGNRALLDGRVAVCTFCLGDKDFGNNAATDGCTNLYADSSSAASSQGPETLWQLLTGVFACFLSLLVGILQRHSSSYPLSLGQDVKQQATLLQMHTNEL